MTRCIRIGRACELRSRGGTNPSWAHMPADYIRGYGEALAKSFRNASRIETWRQIKKRRLLFSGGRS